MNTNPNPRVVLNFARLTTAMLIMFCRHVISSLTGNLNFGTLNPTLAVATTSVDALEAADNAAMNGGRVEIAVRKQAKVATVDLFRQLAASVQNQGKSDRAILIGSGFGVTKVPTPVGPVGPPEPPKVVFGKKPGEIKATVKRVRGVSSMMWRIALQSAPTVYLEEVTTPAGNYTFKGLTAGAVYLIQACAVATDGQSGWSPTSALMAL